MTAPVDIDPPLRTGDGIELGSNVTRQIPTIPLPPSFAQSVVVTMDIVTKAADNVSGLLDSVLGKLGTALISVANEEVKQVAGFLDGTVQFPSLAHTDSVDTVAKQESIHDLLKIFQSVFHIRQRVGKVSGTHVPPMFPSVCYEIFRVRVIGGTVIHA